ncbi:hypothetical protein CPC16_008342 [Podila verticillata]|nr:hypothetical protein BGZ59_008922 [Podila verticillata]KAF9384670.1 hypothetical protein CPC16_008342 [Podila verticillata]KAI9242593.1 MAG: hypothetical protein BYD32DRAFT_456757 [Podila humilis]KFH67467.1 hypothetical protein MVEG_06199 [Podila verticillata NRRL 6337]
MADSNATLQFRVLPASDIPLAYAIETAVYPEGEPATQETIAFRQSAAPELIFGCYDTVTDTRNLPEGGTLIAYINSTKAQGDRLTHASMYAHDPAGNAICIHSVCVAASHQRRGIASKTLRAYLAHIRQLGQDEEERTGHRSVDRVLLIAHRELMCLYAGVGFQEVGLSDVVHGPDPWYEMVYRFD